MSVYPVSAYRGVFFDLDGTLIDTAPDMGLALNLLLAQYNRRSLELSQIRPFVSHGSAAMLKLGFGIDTDEPEFESLRQQYLQTYQANIAVESRLFPELEKLLDQLDAADIPWGIVTNKPEYLARELLNKLNLSARLASLIGGDTLTLRKPHPEPLLTACAQANCAADHSLYVGDAQRDIAAAKAAGMKSCTALYGYIPENEDPVSWAADYTIAQAAHLSEIIFA